MQALVRTLEIAPPHTSNKVKTISENMLSPFILNRWWSTHTKLHIKSNSSIISCWDLLS